MKLIIHHHANQKIAEIVSDSLEIVTGQDALRILEELYPSEAWKFILHRENIAPEFFDLRTGLAGEVLQKFVNYHLQLAIVGDFKYVASDSLKAFIYESNRGNQIFFLGTVAEAVQKLSTASQAWDG